MTQLMFSLITKSMNRFISNHRLIEMKIKFYFFCIKFFMISNNFQFYDIVIFQKY